MDEIFEYLETLKNELINQQQQFSNLISENNRIISSIDEILNNPMNIREPRSSNDQPLTSNEIIRYTYAVRYDELQNPINRMCPLSGIIFVGDMMVCKLPCGHIFDGLSICRELSTINSRCPICRMNVRTAIMNANLNTRINANTNANTNANANTRINTNANANSNTRINTNANTRINTNTNANTRINANTNANTNTNANANANVNTNTNTNTMRNRIMRYAFNTNVYEPNINSQYFNYESSSPFDNLNSYDDIITNLLSTALNQTNISSSLNSSQLPTREEISNAIEEIKYENIENPKNESCPIYYEDFSSDTIVCKMKCCGNLYSREGITQWFSGHNTCPTCRHPITNNETINSITPSNNVDVSNGILHESNTFYILRYRL